MNETLEQLNNRKSIRSFTKESVKNEDLRLIFQAAQRCPTSVNGQQISLIYTKDKTKIEHIAKLCGGQKQVATADVFVMFVVDFNRTNYAIESLRKTQMIERSAEGVIVGAVDAGIMLSSLQTAAESLGYGTTAIGAVRLASKEFIKMFNLPKRTYPLVGSTIGVPTQDAKDAPLKPRIPLDSFVFEEKYDDKAVKKGVEQYELDLKRFREINDINYLASYKERVAGFYEKAYIREVEKVFKEQGFLFSDNI